MRAFLHSAFDELGEKVSAFGGINGWFIDSTAEANVKTSMWSESVNHSSMVSCRFSQDCMTLVDTIGISERLE